MRVAVLSTLLFLSACASEKLALAPPPGVDFSGHWTLNEADSDDPQRLVQSQMKGPAAADPGTSGSRGGRGGGRGSRRTPGGDMEAGSATPAVLPAVGALSEGLRWPGKALDIKQVAGVVAITSAGESRIYQPVGDLALHPSRKRSQSDAASRDRDFRRRDRGDGPPPVCGWDGKILVVQSGDIDDDYPPFEERYSVSGDGQRLIQVVAFKNWQTGGFTVSRVWDRAQ